MKLAEAKVTPALGLATLLSLAVMLSISATGCGLGYYTRTAWGGAKILAQRDSIDRLVADPRTDEELRLRLSQAGEARDFAAQVLALPDNKSYRHYSEVRRAGERSPYVVWNVVAAPEFSVEPLTWCFPIAGCVAYRAYFSPQQAARRGRALDAEGYDVDVYGVRAYSTLGRFADPVLSTFLFSSSPHQVAGHLFHELAHQVVYVKGDTVFNESFATLVEEEGLRRWLESRGDDETMKSHRVRKAHDEEFRALVLSYRERLARCYADARPDDWKRRQKARLIGELRAEYEVLKTGWADDSRWDSWFDGEINNADFALMASYHGLAASFRRVLEGQGNDLPAFYAEVARIASLDRSERLALLVGD